MNIHFDFIIDENISFSFTFFILTLWYIVSANNTICNLISEKRFQNEMFEQNDEPGDSFDEIDDETDQNEHAMVKLH